MLIGSPVLPRFVDRRDKTAVGAFREDLAPVDNQKLNMPEKEN